MPPDKEPLPEVQPPGSGMTGGPLPPPSARAGRGRVLRLAPLVILLAAPAGYLGVLHAPFVFDDVKLVAENELLRVEGAEAASRLTGALRIWSRDWDSAEVRENYRPLRFLSYWVDYRLSRWLLDDFPDDAPPPLFFHLQNILWHVANALLVLALGRRLLGSRPAGLILALLFAVHPLMTEAVTYVSGRRDVLSTFFFLAALWLLVRCAPKDPARWSTVLLAPLLFLAGLFTKEMVITLPALALWVDLARRARFEARRVAVHASLWAIAGWFVHLTLSNRALIAAPVGGGAGSTILTAPRYVARYLLLTLLPRGQSIDYSFDAIPASTGIVAPPTTLLAIGLVLALAAAAVVSLVRGRAVLAIGLAWFLGTLAPVLQIVPIPERFAERFAYLPSLGVLLVAAGLLDRLATRRPRTGVVCVAGLALLLLTATVVRNRDWRSPLALWGAAVRAQPRCARAHLALGNALKDSGAHAEAVAAYDRALEIWAERETPLPVERGLALQARMFRGGVLAILGKDSPEHLARAIRDLERVLASRDTDGVAIEGSPRHALIHAELAKCYLAAGRREEAAERFRRITRLGAPAAREAEAWYWLGKLRLAEEDLDGAIDGLEKAADLLPAGAPTLVSVQLELADIHFDLRDDPESAWQILERLRPRVREGVAKAAVLLRQAKILDRRGEVGASLDRLREALDADPGSEAVLLTIAGIEATLGRYDEAEDHYRRILRQHPDHVAAGEGLRNLRLQRSAREGGDEDAEVMRGLYSRARQHFERGELLAARGVFGELARVAAEADVREMVALAWCGIAEVEENLGREDEAASALTHALSADPRRPETLLKLGGYWMRRGDEPSRARDYYRRYLEALGPDDTADPMAHFHLAYLILDSEPAEAVQHLETARSLGIEEELGSDAFLVDKRLGYLHARLGDWDASLEAFDRYLEASQAVEPETEREKALRFLDEKVIPHLIDDDG